MGSGRLYCFVLGLTLNAVSLLPAMAQDGQADVGEPFGTLSLIDQVIVGENEDEHGFVESAPGVSVIEEILGRPTRVLVNEAVRDFSVTGWGRARAYQHEKHISSILNIPKMWPEPSMSSTEGANMPGI